MGCILSCFKNPSGQVPLEETTEEPTVYSWDKRDRSNMQDFIIDGRKGETVVKHPGSVNGEQIVIQNCEDCTIYVFDHIATVSVDDCVNCNIFLGPIKSSVFIRDCKQCRVVVACQQYRTRDCFKIDTFLLCGTQPIIESSSHMRFDCFTFFYTQLERQFQAAGLSVYNNNWSNIHAFTPVPGEDSNFTYLPVDSKVEDFLPLPQGDEFGLLKLNTSKEASVVPFSTGNRRKTSHESCLTVFFNDGGASERAAKFIKSVLSQNPQCCLVQTKEVPLQVNEAERIFASDAYSNAVTQGPVIGLEINGDNSVALCQAAVLELTKGINGVVFVSPSKDTAEQQVEAFYASAEMQMGM